jgi:hypothetical protein
VFGPELVAFLESGCSAIVGTVAADGEPHAGRGWGIDVLDPDRGIVRLLVAAGDATTVRHLAAGGAVAVTGADVPTLRSVQLKGRSLGIEPTTDSDRRRSRRFCDEFFSDIVETDGTERGALERLVPHDVVACRVQVDEIFDQTPGPGAGAPLPAETR